MDSTKAINANKALHDSVSKAYNHIHSEIFNDFEQKRVDDLIKELISLIGNKEIISIMDLGSGTGNLTFKFLKEKCGVTSTDVSKEMLEKIISTCPKNLRHKHKTRSLNGDTLPFPDNSFDISATYSVLHHIPNYLKSVKEMIRVTKTNGLIYIDHEFNENYWNPNAYLTEYYKLTKKTSAELIIAAVEYKRVLEHLKYFLIKIFVDKNYTLEGDLHISKEDHVEWGKIEQIMQENNCEIIIKKPFLMYRPEGGMELYKKYSKETTDTLSLVARKK